MKTIKKLPRQLLALAAVAVSLASIATSASAQDRKLPFRVKKDGTVNYEDLKKLTRQAPSRDSITDDELAAIKSKHVIEYDSFFTPTDEAKSPPRSDLYADSIILSDGVNHTLLPKRSLVFVPERYQRRVVDAPVGKLILWPTFNKINSSWLRVQEVSLPIAKGEEPLADGIRRQLESGFQVVVSTYKQSPISVMPLKEPSEVEGEENKLSKAGTRLSRR